MLLRFRVSNYRSINDLQEFSMVAGDVRRHYSHINRTGNMKTLKFSALFGANASGKSTVVKALSFLKESVVGKYLPMESTAEWCQIYPENKTKPSTFEVDFKIDNTVYSYGLAVILAENRILGEWVNKHELASSEDETEILNRELGDANTNTITIANISQDSFIFREILEGFDAESEENTNMTILSEFGRLLRIGRANSPNQGKQPESLVDLMTVYAWFAGTLQIIKPLPFGGHNTEAETDSETISREIKAAMQRKVNLQDIKLLACRLGLGVNGIRLSNMTDADIRETFTRKELYEYGKYFPNLGAAKETSRASLSKSIKTRKLDELQAALNNLIKSVSKSLETYKSLAELKSYDIAFPPTLEQGCTRNDLTQARDVLRKLHNKLSYDLEMNRLAATGDDDFKKEADSLADWDETLKEVIDHFSLFESRYDELNEQIVQLQADLAGIDQRQHDASLWQSEGYDPDKSQTGSLIPLGNSLIFCSDDEEKPYTVKIEFLHGPNKASISYDAESDGTKRMMELLEIVCAAKYGARRTYVVDEIDRSLHPQLTYQLVKEFLHATQENGETQLFITTHEAHILEMSLVRQDEIWIVDKNTDGSSSLYSLSDFKNEHIADKDVVTRYLDGRYGGVPLFDTLFPMDQTPPENSSDMQPSEDVANASANPSNILSEMAEIESKLRTLRQNMRAQKNAK